MRIVAWGDPTRLNTPHRVLRPMEALSSRGHDASVVLEEEDRIANGLGRRADVLLVHRFHSRRAYEVIRAFRDAGGAVVWDTDDELTMNLPGASVRRSRQSLYSQQSSKMITAMARSADVVTTPSRVLAASLEMAGAQYVRIVENYLPDGFVRRSRHSSANITIGAVAAIDHSYDLRELRVTRSLCRLLERYPNVRVVSIGTNLGIDSDRYAFIPHVPYDQLASHIARFDIGIAPLANVRFNQCRANSKLKEYGAAGVPWLASPVGPYEHMGEKQGGRLVSDNDWYDQMERLVLNERERRRLGKRARRWARGQTIKKNAHVWEDVLHQAVERSRRRVGA